MRTALTRQNYARAGRESSAQFHPVACFWIVRPSASRHNILVMQPISCNLGRLGSRLNIIFEPQHQRIRHSALGLFLDQHADLLIGIEDTTGKIHAFPFSKRGIHLQYIETRITPTTVTWVGACVPLFVLIECTFTAPFWPQDEHTSLWPGYFISINVRPMRRIRWHKQRKPPKNVKLVFDLQRPGRLQSKSAPNLEFRYKVPLVPSNEDTILADWPVNVQTDMVAQAQDWIGPVTSGWSHQKNRLTTTLKLHPHQPVSAPSLMWVAHTESVVLDAHHQPARFRYIRYWNTIRDAIQFGKQHATSLLRKSAVFDSLIANSALSSPAQHLFAQSFQSYLMNTWWCDRLDGADWFSVWEGSCLFHSTVDVEYNASMFYFLFWPRLLQIQLQQWTRHLKPNPRGPGRYLDHDMGAGCLADGNRYGHIMGVEEAANFLLLLNAHVRFNGDVSLLDNPDIHSALLDLTRYLLWTDQRGRGFPTEDVANTVDDGCPAIQFGREQVYLAVKRLCALRAAESLLAQFHNQPDLLRAIRSAAVLTKRTLKQNAWLDDHFAVCIDPDASNVTDPYTGKLYGKGKLAGWDDHHIYASNGLLLLLLTSTLHDKELVPFMRQDILTGIRDGLGPYGCSHNAGDPLNVWISQNIWRDCVAHYLDQPIPDLTPRYWDLQVWSNTGEQTKCFIDTYLNNNLSRYPRGIACAGYFLSLAGLQMDRTRNQQSLNPVIPHGCIPLFPLANWQTGTVPILTIRKGKPHIEPKHFPLYD